MNNACHIGLLIVQQIHVVVNCKKNPSVYTLILHSNIQNRKCEVSWSNASDFLVVSNFLLQKGEMY